MKIYVIAVGQRLPGFINDGVNEYLQRFPPHFPVILREIKAVNKQGNNKEITMQAERIKILDAIPPNAFICVLDELGEKWSSKKLSQQIVHWQSAAQDIAFIIGGADGIDKTLKSQAHYQLSLSNMTLPHGLARLILIEQIYRAWTITQNHPYHRE